MKIFKEPAIGIPDPFQIHSIILCNSKRQFFNDWMFRMNYMILNYASARLLKPKTVRLSDILVETGFVPSKKEFHRKIAQKGIKYNNIPLERDIEIDTEIPSIDHEIRLGTRFLEILVPTEAPLTEYLWVKVKFILNNFVTLF